MPESKIDSRCVTMANSYLDVFVSKEIRRKAGSVGKSNSVRKGSVAGHLHSKCLKDAAS